MGIKILGGSARGLELSVPKGDKIRPTSVILKRKPFDSFQNFENSYFFDFCAGTGSVGLEALSRGAKKVYLIEKDRKVFQILKGNIEKIKSTISGDVSAVSSDIIKWVYNFKDIYLQLAPDERGKTTVFFDPPYEKHDLYSKICSFMLKDNEWFEGQFWVESDKLKGPKLFFWDDYPESKKKFEQGDRYILCF